MLLISFFSVYKLCSPCQETNNPWDAVFDQLPSAEKVNRYRQPRAIVTKNVILGKDLCDRSPQETSYCSCGNCKPVKKPVEAFCCKEIGVATTSWACNFEKFTSAGCICDDQDIKNAVHNESELRTFIDTVKAYSSSADTEEVELMSRNYRFALYKKLTIMIHRHLGAKVRLPLPSCLVYFVRTKYPEDDEEDYCGFSEAL